MKIPAIALFILATAAVFLVVNAEDDKPVRNWTADETLASATFAGGCFWCIESDFEQVPGVAEAVSGYTGGRAKNPTYAQVAGGSTGHLESVMVYYDPNTISYQGLLAAFWRMIDPTDSGGQFSDRGEQYSPAIFYHSPEQKAAAEKSRDALAASGRYDDPIATAIRPAGEFYQAEEKHQDYFEKHPIRYSFYRRLSGRDQYLEVTWKEEKEVDVTESSRTTTSDYPKPDDTQLRKQLTPLQYEVTQQEGTERPFDNEFWNEKREGVYVDIVSGEPLFSSQDKFESGTGWPSFTQPLETDFVVEETDFKLIYPRTEVRSLHGDSHLGHVFKDGPEPTGLRYCINSASLRFIPKEELDKEGYGRYLGLFDQSE